MPSYSSKSGSNFESIGPLQTRVMHFIWTQPGGVRVHDVHQAINAEGGPQLAYTTILTVMRNLARRGFLDQVREGKSKAHVFRAKVTKGEYQIGAVSYLLETCFQRNANVFSHAVERVVASETVKTRPAVAVA